VISVKALILAGGRGNRLNELSLEQNKCMTLVRGRRLIEYNLDCALDVDVEEIVLVVGYRAETVINFLGNHYRGKPIKYVIQGEQKGLVHAIECAQATVNGDDFFLMLGDEVLFRPKHQDMVAAFQRDPEIFAMCGIVKVRDRNQIRKTYTMIQGPNHDIYRLIEKPRRPLNDFQGTGHCVFRNRIYDYIKYTPIHHERNEKELPDLIQCAIDDAMTIKAFMVCDRYTNVNTREDVQMAEGFFA
jgi:UDP-N-acetylglucosamine diphosphorylase / glucose-1-phosphate thymidylyltransferase / UDP-N-acetylgalactosamine diphosphorylase / glucosamine-1-phosphate N-acetyltransferase / galactosamine-1-phosphate N-acetyltransferase